jgi:hypothetical protein
MGVPPNRHKPLGVGCYVTSPPPNRYALPESAHASRGAGFSLGLSREANADSGPPHANCAVIPHLRLNPKSLLGLNMQVVTYKDDYKHSHQD